MKFSSAIKLLASEHERFKRVKCCKRLSSRRAAYFAGKKVFVASDVEHKNLTGAVLLQQATIATRADVGYERDCYEIPSECLYAMDDQGDEMIDVALVVADVCFPAGSVRLDGIDMCVAQTVCAIEGAVYKFPGILNPSSTNDDVVETYDDDSDDESSVDSIEHDDSPDEDSDDESDDCSDEEPNKHN